MQLFIDSSSPEEIRQARQWGIIDGVTTNPSLMSKVGPDAQAALAAVVEASPGQVFCQVIGGQDVATLKAQARWLHKFSSKIIIKLPMTIAGLKALQELKKDTPQMPLAVTAVASIAQAYLVAKCGADVVALFNGPLDQALDQPVDLVAPIRKVYGNYGFKTRILSCGRLPRAFGEFAAAGTDICTLRFEFLKLLFEHPYTESRMNGFMRDWHSTYGDKRWPEA